MTRQDSSGSGTPEPRQSTDQRRDAGAQLLAAYLKEADSGTPRRPFTVTDTEAGRVILSAEPATQIGVLLAAADHFAKLRSQIKAASGFGTWNVHLLDDYSPACVELMRAVFRRKLPYADYELSEVVELAAVFPTLCTHSMPHLEGLVRNLERCVRERPPSSRMGIALERLRVGLSQVSNAPERKLADRVSRLLAEAGIPAAITAIPPEPASAPAQACDGPGGFPDARSTVGVIRPFFEQVMADREGWALLADDFAECRRRGVDMLDAVLARLPKSLAGHVELNERLTAAHATLPEDKRRPLGLAVLAVRILVEDEVRARYGKDDLLAWHHWANVCSEVVTSCLANLAMWTKHELLDLVRMVTRAVEIYSPFLPLHQTVQACEGYARENEIDVDLREAFLRLRERCASDYAPSRQTLVTRVDALLGRTSRLGLEPGERWTDAAIQHVDALDPAVVESWSALVRYAREASGSKPSATWRRGAAGVVDALGSGAFLDAVLAWFPFVGKSRGELPGADIPGRDSTLLAEQNANVLKGLVWCCARFDEPRVSTELADLAVACFKKVPGVGPRCIKAGNACIYSLGQMKGAHAVSQLARLRQVVKFGSARKLLEKALDQAAERAGVSRADIEELAVPDYGLGPNGVRREQLGEFTCELAITGTSRAELRWFKADGKTLKSVPAAVKANCADDLKRLKQTAADIQRMLPAQRDRIERLLLGERCWPLGLWRQRYLDHPLISGLARRLIWQFTADGRSGLGICRDSAVVDVEDRPIEWIGDRTVVHLWHPIGFSADIVLAWRQWLERHEVSQPFKQAHREVYILTDAELATRTYSNRFAAHILKQGQLNALCRQRGWRLGQFMIYDPTYGSAPLLRLPEWNLRAEYWMSGAEEAVDAKGAFLFVQTDQVRFYRGDEREPLPLTEVPALVFTEVMRDVDLFVGVGSVGNDPTWQDHGKAGFDGYWQDYSFGVLTVSAETRRDVLGRLLPRLAIYGRCSIEGRFLVVRGDVRTYKIHLGSGNILMEPNDQYLCIVPSYAGAAGGSKVFLPFEGDRTLSLILSKALLLAEDAKITDETIVRQIRGR